MIEVWRIDVRAEACCLARHRSSLNADELDRASRFSRDDDRIRFLIARSTRRELLARSLGCEPRSLEFVTGPFGKPRLADRHGRAPEFNTSHSGDWILHAFADVPVGIDVEQAHPDVAVFEELLWAFSAGERNIIERTPQPERGRALAAAWARKEAYVKAVGEGLSRPLSRIEIAVGCDRRAALSHDHNPASGNRCWTFVDLAIAPDYTACLVHAGAPRRVTVRDYAGTASSR